MNNWHIELMAEYHRQQILKEVEQIRLEKVALQPRVYRARIFERIMFNFANWMITTGKQMRNRYTQSSTVDEVPAVHCRTSPNGSFAH